MALARPFVRSLLPARFMLGESLAMTGLGELFLAYDNVTASTVVIKVSGTTKSKERAPENPRQEARILAEITRAGHAPNVVKLIESFVEEQVQVMIFEYGAGGDLFDLLDGSDKGCLEEESACLIFHQMALGLNSVHKLGFAHLDVSLENFVITSAGLVKLCDFGLARPSHDTKDTAGIGKLGYMAPEILQPSLQQLVPRYDLRSADLYSLGVSLFLVLAGFPPYEMPFDSDSRFKLLMLGGLRQLVGEYKLELSEELLHLLEHLLCPMSCRFSIDEVLSHSWIRMMLTRNLALSADQQQQQQPQHTLFNNPTRPRTSSCSPSPHCSLSFSSERGRTIKGWRNRSAISQAGNMLSKKAKCALVYSIRHNRNRNSPFSVMVHDVSPTSGSRRISAKPLQNITFAPRNTSFAPANTPPQPLRSIVPTKTTPSGPLSSNGGHLHFYGPHWQPNGNFTPTFFPEPHNTTLDSPRGTSRRLHSELPELLSSQAQSGWSTPTSSSRSLGDSQSFSSSFGHSPFESRAESLLWDLDLWETPLDSVSGTRQLLDKCRCTHSRCGAHTSAQVEPAHPVWRTLIPGTAC